MLLLKKIIKKVNLNNFKIRTHLLFFFVIIIFICVATTTAITFYIYSKTMTDRTKVYIQDSLTSANTNIDGVISRLDDISLTLLANDDIQDVLSKDSYSEDSEKTSDITKVINALSNIYTGYSKMKSITILSKNGEVYNVGIRDASNQISDPEIIKKSKLYKELTDTYGNTLIYVGDEDILLNKYKNVQKIYVARKIMSKIEANKVIGYIFIDLDENEIINIYNTKFWCNQGSFFIIKKSGELVSGKGKNDKLLRQIVDEFSRKYNNVENGSSISVLNNEKDLVTTRTSKYTGWKLVSVFPYSFIASEWDKTKNFIILICVICIVTAFIISFFFSTNLTKPIKSLIIAMKKVGSGDFNISVKSDREDEIGQLSEIFNKMTIQIRELINKIEQEQNLKRESELKLLQYQINPHFFYNALDTVNWLAQSAKQKKIEIVVSSLSKLFRISLSKGQDVITIRQELEHVESYLTIQKIRLGDMFDYEIKADESLMDLRTVKLILQPLVENSINHGLKKIRYEGFIRVECVKSAESVLFVVSDNGIGIPVDTLDSLEKYIRREIVESGESFGFGLRNINDRLNLKYGVNNRLTFTEGLKTGTEVRITIPCEK